MILNIIGIFDNANAKSSGEATMRFKFPLSEIGNWSQLLLLINREVKARVEVDMEGKQGIIKLGSIIFKSLSIDHEGEARFTVVGESMDLSKIYDMLDKEIKLTIKAEDTAAISVEAGAQA